MSNLKELIDNLYEEVSLQQAGQPAKVIDKSDDLIFDAERLRLTLQQMNAILQPEDLKDLQPASALSSNEATRLLMQWDSLCNSIDGLKRHMQELDADITRMQPWGDFDVVKLQELAQKDCHVRFWTLPVSAFATQATEPWHIDQQATLISQDASDAYFITISIGNEKTEMPASAKEVEICPCPMSTLIMLQTRDKDSLKRVATTQGDFALAHYAELRETLRQLLPPGADLPKQRTSHRQILKSRLQKLFRKS